MTLYDLLAVLIILAIFYVIANITAYISHCIYEEYQIWRGK